MYPALITFKVLWCDQGIPTKVADAGNDVPVQYTTHRIRGCLLMGDSTDVVRSELPIKAEDWYYESIRLGVFTV
jgi:hypothetical protein